MSTFGDELIQSLSEALAHAKEDGPAIVHPSDPTRDSQESEAKADTDGTADVHESFWHPEMGTVNTVGQRPCRNPSARNRYGA